MVAVATSQLVLLSRFDHVIRFGCSWCGGSRNLASAKKPRGYAGCRTDFQWSSIPQQERGFLLFSAPSPKETTVPSQLLRWKETLRDKGTLVIFVGENQQQLYQSRGILTVCVEHTDDGLPRFDHMMRRMHKLQRDPTGVVAFINADIDCEDASFNGLHHFLTKKLHNNSLQVLETPKKIYEPYKATGRFTTDWFAVSIRTDIFLNGTELPHTTGGYDFWAWNSGQKPLLPIDIPPFRYPLANYDNWLLDMIVQGGDRMAIDVSNLVRLVHREHKRVGDSTNWPQALRTGVTGIYVNKHLSYTRKLHDKRGRIWTFGTPLSTPYVAGGNHTLSQRTYWSNLPDDKLPECNMKKRCRQTKRVLNNTRVSAESVSLLPYLDSNVSGAGELWDKVVKNWRYSAKYQLEHRNKNNSIILTAASSTNLLQLRNFKCTMDRVGASSDWVAAALDVETYRWGVLQGFPVFLGSRVLNQNENVSGGDKTENLLQESSLVLRVLEVGYSVVWSNPNIAWSEHPQELLKHHLYNREIAIQHASTSSLDSRRRLPQSLERRLDPSVYVAPSTPTVRQAFREIVRRQEALRLNTTVAFDDVLCDAPRINRYSNKKMPCMYQRDGHEDVTVRFLDHFHISEGDTSVDESRKRDFAEHRPVPTARSSRIWYANGLDGCIDV